VGGSYMQEKLFACWNPVLRTTGKFIRMKELEETIDVFFVYSNVC